MFNIYLEHESVKRSAKFGIVLTSYGRDKLLDKAIKSVLNQTYKNFILFIIDDNSSAINPKTQPIIMKNLQDNVVYFRTKTTKEDRKTISTFCRNINCVLEYMKINFDIEYVSYLPCDDYFYFNKLEEIHTFKKDVFYHGLDLVNKARVKIGQVPCFGPTRPISTPVGYLDHSCVIHKLSLLDKIEKPYWPLNKNIEAIAPDGAFFEKLVRVNGPIYNIEKQLGAKLIHKESIQGRFKR
jgi:spore maturation protein CgeD